MLTKLAASYFLTNLKIKTKQSMCVPCQSVLRLHSGRANYLAQQTPQMGNKGLGKMWSFWDVV